MESFKQFSYDIRRELDIYKLSAIASLYLLRVVYLKID